MKQKCKYYNIWKLLLMESMKLWERRWGRTILSTKYQVFIFKVVLLYIQNLIKIQNELFK